MLLAEAACVWRKEQRHEVRAQAFLLSAVSNNLPDVDVAYTWLIGPKPIGNLLHHRGHTHTLLVALPLAWLLGYAAWRWFARRTPSANGRERQLLFGLALLGPVVHLALDFGNNYGVHPFWPFLDDWYYGDSIFIVEPLWLAVLVPVLAHKIIRRWLRVVLWVVLTAVVILYWYLPFFNATTRFVLLGVVALSFTLTRRSSERGRVLYAGGAFVAVAVVFSIGSSLAKAQARSAAVAAFPALSVHDVAAAPLPGNPACWETLVAGEQGGSYRVLRATVALRPLSPESCHAGTDVEPTAPVTRLDRPLHGGVRWQSEYHADVAELAQLRRANCRFRALLRFTRLPYVAASGRIAGDLRYDRGPGLDFSDAEIVPQTPCPTLVPSWREPRAELFQP